MYRFCHQAHFQKILRSETLRELVEFGFVDFAQKQTVAFEKLVIADDHIAGFQFFDEIRVGLAADLPDARTN